MESIHHPTVIHCPALTTIDFHSSNSLSLSHTHSFSFLLFCFSFSLFFLSLILSDFVLLHLFFFFFFFSLWPDFFIFTFLSPHLFSSLLLSLYSCYLLHKSHLSPSSLPSVPVIRFSFPSFFHFLFLLPPPSLCRVYLPRFVHVWDADQDVWSGHPALLPLLIQLLRLCGECTHTQILMTNPTLHLINRFISCFPATNEQ